MFAGRLSGRCCRAQLAAAVSLAVVAGLLVGTPAAAVAGAAAQAARPVVPLASPQSSDVPGLATGHPGAVLASPLPVTPDTPPVHVSGSAPAAGGFVPGGSVENVAARTATMKVFDNPDGSHTAQISTLRSIFGMWRMGVCGRISIRRWSLMVPGRVGIARGRMRGPLGSVLHRWWSSTRRPVGCRR